MRSLSRITGIAKLVSFYEYIRFDGPRWVTGAGIGLILLVGLVHLLEAPGHLGAATYVGVLFLVNVAGSVVAALGIYRGARAWGWTLGTVISAVSLVLYAVSRAFGLPGLGEETWANPVGTVTMGLEALYLGIYFSIITGMNVAVPDKRDWHD